MRFSACASCTWPVYRAFVSFLVTSHGFSRKQVSCTPYSVYASLRGGTTESSILDRMIGSVELSWFAAES